MKKQCLRSDVTKAAGAWADTAVRPDNRPDRPEGLAVAFATAGDAGGHSVGD